MNSDTAFTLLIRASARCQYMLTLLAVGLLVQAGPCAGACNTSALKVAHMHPNGFAVIKKKLSKFSAHVNIISFSC